MKRDTKKMIAPIIITIIIVLYYVGLIVLISTIDLPLLLTIILFVLFVFLGIAMIIVCIQRLKEIKGGEEDDLSKY